MIELDLSESGLLLVSKYHYGVAFQARNIKSISKMMDTYLAIEKYSVDSLEDWVLYRDYLQFLAKIRGWSTEKLLDNVQNFFREAETSPIWQPLSFQQSLIQQLQSQIRLTKTTGLSMPDKKEVDLYVWRNCIYKIGESWD